jgi:hypothetical protein
VELKTRKPTLLKSHSESSTDRVISTIVHRTKAKFPWQIELFESYKMVRNYAGKYTALGNFELQHC